MTDYKDKLEKKLSNITLSNKFESYEDFLKTSSKKTYQNRTALFDFIDENSEYLHEIHEQLVDDFQIKGFLNNFDMSLLLKHITNALTLIKVEEEITQDFDAQEDFVDLDLDLTK